MDASRALVDRAKHYKEDQPMPSRQQIESAHGNQHPSGSICDHCGGTTTHETWCITCNAVVCYAYGIVLDGRRMTVGDELVLHALGVEWGGRGL